jgi:hypothetical protein
MKKMNKAKQIKKLKKQLDIKWSLIVRSKGVCEAIGRGNMQCSGNLQASHIFSRSHHGTRWDLDNGLCLCSAHHLFWGHKEPYEFIKFCEELKGKEELERLHIKARGIFKVTLDSLQQIKLEEL